METETTLTIEDNRKWLRYSKLTAVNNCPRKAEIQSYIYEENGGYKTIDTAFGTAFGAGVAALLTSNNNLLQGYLSALVGWQEEVVPLHSDAGKNKKSFGDCLLAIEKYHNEYAPQILQDWEVLILPNGKPAVETFFVIDLPNGFHFGGHIDLVLKHRTKKLISVRELKTQGAALHEAKYAKSYQALGYAVALAHCYPDYTVEKMYEVYETSERNLVCFYVPQTRLDAVRWLVALLTESRRIGDYIQFGVFPQNGANCMQWNKICNNYYECSDSNHEHPDWLPKPVSVEDIDLRFKFDDLAKTLKVQTIS